MSGVNSLAYHRRVIRALREELEDLRADSEVLDNLRNNGHVFDAILFYLTLPHLSDVERDKIREECLVPLARGGGQ